MNDSTANNSKTEKLRVALYTRGTGVILFALWSVLQIFILSFVDSDSLYIQDADGLSPMTMFMIALIVGVVDAGLRIYVGRSAISFSRGGRLRRFSLFLAGFFAVFTVAVYVLYIALLGLPSLPPRVLVSMLVDITVIILNIEIIVFTLRLKKAEA